MNLLRLECSRWIVQTCVPRVSKYFWRFYSVERIPTRNASFWWIATLESLYRWTLRPTEILLMLFWTTSLWWKITSRCNINYARFMILDRNWKVWLSTTSINFKDIRRRWFWCWCDVAVENSGSIRSWPFFRLRIGINWLIMSIPKCIYSSCFKTEFASNECLSMIFCESALQRSFFKFSLRQFLHWVVVQSRYYWLLWLLQIFLLLIEYILLLQIGIQILISDLAFAASAYWKPFITDLMH